MDKNLIELYSVVAKLANKSKRGVSDYKKRVIADAAESAVFGHLYDKWLEIKGIESDHCGNFFDDNFEYVIDNNILFYKKAEDYTKIKTDMLDNDSDFNLLIKGQTIGSLFDSKNKSYFAGETIDLDFQSHFDDCPSICLDDYSIIETMVENGVVNYQTAVEDGYLAGDVSEADYQKYTECLSDEIERYKEELAEYGIDVGSLNDIALRGIYGTNCNYYGDHNTEFIKFTNRALLDYFSFREKNPELIRNFEKENFLIDELYDALEVVTSGMYVTGDTDCVFGFEKEKASFFIIMDIDCNNDYYLFANISVFLGLIIYGINDLLFEATEKFHFTDVEPKIEGVLNFY